MILISIVSYFGIELEAFSIMELKHFSRSPRHIIDVCEIHYFVSPCGKCTLNTLHSTYDDGGLNSMLECDMRPGKPTCAMPKMPRKHRHSSCRNTNYMHA